MELLGKIRRMHLRDKISERAIAKRTGLSRNTVHKWLQTPEEVAAPKYVRAKKFGKLAGFVDELEQALKADAGRNKQDRRTVVRRCICKSKPAAMWAATAASPTTSEPGGPTRAKPLKPSCP